MAMCFKWRFVGKRAGHRYYTHRQVYLCLTRSHHQICSLSPWKWVRSRLKAGGTTHDITLFTSDACWLFPVHFENSFILHYTSLLECMYLRVICSVKRLLATFIFYLWAWHIMWEQHIFNTCPFLWMSFTHFVVLNHFI